MIDEQQIERAQNGDLETLAELDKRGFIVGADEDAKAFVTRVKALKERFNGMEEALAQDGACEVEGLTFPAERRIPQELISNVSEITRTHYGFGIDWVPGFFADQSFGWLFGGCAYYFEPEFFALFIIRRSFENKNRWLIYNRDELLSHELCHVARGGLKANFFEEEFAYGVSGSSFRKYVGGLFRTGNEAFYILGTTLLLLVAQIVRLFMFPELPIWPFWLVLVGIMAFFTARLLQLRKLVKSARKNLFPIAGDETEKILFRCTDLEILHITQTDDPASLRLWLEEQRKSSLRWKVIYHRFMEAAPTED